MQIIEQGTIHVFTFSEGLLSVAGHDLRFTAQRFRLELDQGRIFGRFFTEALHLDGVMRGGLLLREALSPAQCRDIYINLRQRVLFTDRHPEIVFSGNATGNPPQLRVRGELTLVGRPAPLEFSVEHANSRFRGHVELRPSLWGIKSYRAL
ncbi:MAG TPA: YceI family protein, partial [Polyangiaceae bacterium]